MLFAVVPTHTHGKRRSKEEMASAEQVVGHLLIRDWLAGGAGRPLRAAYLEDLSGRFPRSVLTPIFDVQVVKMTPTGMHIVGFQIEADSSTATEYVQGWWAKLQS